MKTTHFTFSFKFRLEDWILQLLKIKNRKMEGKKENLGSSVRKSNPGPQKANANKME